MNDPAPLQLYPPEDQSWLREFHTTPLIGRNLDYLLDLESASHMPENTFSSSFLDLPLVQPQGSMNKCVPNF